ncbi:MAG: sugar phosphate isomerase/epimerase [Firmicutes bacterium]|nr:sugar phosphate isomerase/epimerase [Bacillota bacterium]
MHFGMPTLIENKTLEDNIELCSRLGLNFIELNMNFPEYQIDKLEDAERFINAAENKGIYYTIHLDENLDIADFNPLVAEAYLETVRRTIDVAKKFLCLLKDDELPLVINMHMNHGIHITLPDQKVQMYQRDFDTYIKSFAAFKTKCEEWIGDSNIRIAIENTDGFRDYEKKAIELLLESPVFGLTWDIGHSKAAKEVDVPFILAHKENLIHFHIHDGTEEPPRNHLSLGDGEIDLKDRLLTAKEQGARCVLETKTISALEKSVGYLRRNL